MIRGYRWKKRDGQSYLTRVSDGREVATVYSGAGSWMWHVRQTGLAPGGSCTTERAARAAAESAYRALPQSFEEAPT